MPGNTDWCTWSYQRVADCGSHHSDPPHPTIISPLGVDDEPQDNGALVVVWPGEYRRQKIWVASGANIGSWYCLGNEFGVPKVWDPEGSLFGNLGRDRDKPDQKRPAGTVPLQPDWDFVIGTGPVALLTTGTDGTYRAGWQAGRRELLQQIESLADDVTGLP